MTFAVIFALLFDVALFFLSAVKNHSYVIQIDSSAIKPEFLEFLCSDLPAFLAVYGRGFLVSLPFLTFGFLMFAKALSGSKLVFCVIGIALSSLFWCLVGRMMSVEVYAEAVLYALSLSMILRVESRGSLYGGSMGFTYPFCVALLLNSYIVYTLLTVESGLARDLVLVSFLAASLVIRGVWLRLRADTRAGNVLFLLLALVVCGAILLAMSYLDFVESADNGGAWRTLHYLLVIVVMLTGNIMPALTDVLRSRDGDGGKFGHRSGLWINAVCAMSLPLLCALSVHGVIVLVAAPLLSLAGCLYAVYRPYAKPAAKHVERYAFASVLSLLTVACMFVDPIAYISPEQEMNVLVPAVASVLGATALAATRRLYLDDGHGERTDFVDAVVDVLTARSPFGYPKKAQIMILAADALTIAVFVLLFTAYQLSLSAVKEDVDALAPVLEGIGGLYRFSWATVPAAVSVLVLDVARILGLRYRPRSTR